MSIDNPKSPYSNAEDTSGAMADEEPNRRKGDSGAANSAVEVLVHGAEMVFDGVGTVLSGVFSSLGDIG